MLETFLCTVRTLNRAPCDTVQIGSFERDSGDMDPAVGHACLLVFACLLLVIACLHKVLSLSCFLLCTCLQTSFRCQTACLLVQTSNTTAFFNACRVICITIQALHSHVCYCNFFLTDFLMFRSIVTTMSTAAAAAAAMLPLPRAAWDL